MSSRPASKPNPGYGPIDPGQEKPASVPLRRAISKTIIYLTAIVCFLSAATLVWIDYERVTQSERSAALDELRNVIDLLEPQAEAADYAMVQKILEVTAKRQTIAEMRFYNRFNTLVVDIRTDKTPTEYIEYELKDRTGVYGGQVMVGLRFPTWENFALRDFAITLTFNVASLLILALFLLDKLETLVVKPVSAIRRHIDNYDGHSWKFLPSSPVYEFGILSDTLNSFGKSLTERASNDPMTGLLNSTAIIRRFEDMAQSADSTQGQRILVIFIDIDHFKHINDRFGHEFGDRLLLTLTSRLRALETPGMAIGRMGGDEFLVIQPLDDENEDEDAIASVLRFQRELRRPYYIGGVDLAVSASIGMAVFPDDAGRISEVIRQADMALYRAKANGRNQWQRSQSDSVTGEQASSNIARGIETGISRSGFGHIFQTIIDVRTDKPYGAEALLFLEGDDGKGPFSNIDVLQVIERRGLWRELTGATLNNAMQWLAAADPSQRVFINLGAEQLRDETIVEMTRDALYHHALPSNRMVIEIVEQDLRGDPVILDNLDQLARMGICLALDDFGSGYSAMVEINRIPISLLKLDQSLAAGLGHNERAEKLFLGLIRLAHSLELKVIAEGIEEKAQVDFLRHAGCDLIQGFFFENPPAGPATITRNEPPAL